MENKPSPYDLSEYRNYLERHKNDKARKKYIEERMSRLRNRDEGINLYDLSQMARVNLIEDEARRMFI
jgi:hypothetical protein